MHVCFLDVDSFPGSNLTVIVLTMRFSPMSLHHMHSPPLTTRSDDDRGLRPKFLTMRTVGIQHHNDSLLFELRSPPGCIWKAMEGVHNFVPKLSDSNRAACQAVVRCCVTPQYIRGEDFAPSSPPPTHQPIFGVVWNLPELIASRRSIRPCGFLPRSLELHPHTPCPLHSPLPKPLP